MQQYNFDEIVPRKGTNCLKHDALEQFFKSADALPLWVADMDFKTPDFIVDAIKKTCRTRNLRLHFSLRFVLRGSN